MYRYLHVGLICAAKLIRFMSHTILQAELLARWRHTNFRAFSFSDLHLCSVHVILKVKTEGGRVLGTSWLYVLSQQRCYDFRNHNLEMLCFTPDPNCIHLFATPCYLKFHSPNTTYFNQKGCEKYPLPSPLLRANLLPS